MRFLKIIRDQILKIEFCITLGSLYNVVSQEFSPKDRIILEMTKTFFKHKDLKTFSFFFLIFVFWHSMTIFLLLLIFNIILLVLGVQCSRCLYFIIYLFYHLSMYLLVDSCI